MHLSGRHPFLLQAAASSLFDDKTVSNEPDEQYRRAGATTYERARAYFEDLWRHLDPRAQCAMVLLALDQVGSLQDGREFDTSEIDHMEWYRPELRHLCSLGLVEEESGVDASPARVSAAAFLLWLTEDIIAGTRDTIDFTIWLREREYDGLLTRKQSRSLKSISGAVPKGFANWAGSVFGELIKSCLKK